jgi:hypothetical protein
MYERCLRGTRRVVARGSLGLLLTALGCRGEPDAGESATAGDQRPIAELPADSALARVEQWLLETAPLQIQYVVVAEGVLEAEVRGALALLGSEGLSLTADGHFAGQPQTLRLATEGQNVRVGEGDSSTVVARPPGLEEAVVIGFTRMGILHNIARLTGGATPDHMEGGVREWVQADSVAWGPREDIGGRPALAIDFNITVDGNPSGRARLYLDAETEQPLQRNQTVNFTEGDMNVTESYEIF